MLARLFKSGAIAFFYSALWGAGLLMLRIVLSILSLASQSGSDAGSFAQPITASEEKIGVGIMVAVFLFLWRSYWRRLGENPDLPIS